MEARCLTLSWWGVMETVLEMEDVKFVRAGDDCAARESVKMLHS